MHSCWIRIVIHSFCLSLFSFQCPLLRLRPQLYYNLVFMVLFFLRVSQLPKYGSFRFSDRCRRWTGRGSRGLDRGSRRIVLPVRCSIRGHRYILKAPASGDRAGCRSFCSLEKFLPSCCFSMVAKQKTGRSPIIDERPVFCFVCYSINLPPAFCASFPTVPQ